MATTNENLSIMGLPLEIRHHIFELASVRDRSANRVLRRWFEKKDVQEKYDKIVQDDPEGPTPQIVYPDEREEEVEAFDDAEAEEEEEGEEGEDNEDEDAEDEDGEDNEEDEEDDEVIDGADFGIDEEAVQALVDAGLAPIGATPEAMMEVLQQEAGAEALEAEALLAAAELGDQAGASAFASHAELEPELQEALDAEMGEADSYDQDEVMDVEGDATEQQEAGDAEDDDEAEQDEANANGEAAENGEDAENDEAAQDENANPPAAPRPVTIMPDRKWRHIPNFIRMSGTPPPTEFLLACKELNREVKDWFYDVSFIRIDVTGSFAHTGMFQLALEQVADSDHSPFHDIRKVELMFVWDSEWIRSQDFAAAVFPTLLNDRVQVLLEILQTRAKELKQATIHWHDSVCDDESAIFKFGILDHFEHLLADIKVEEHYLEPGTKPRRNTIAGKKRLEFQRIVDSGREEIA